MAIVPPAQDVRLSVHNMFGILNSLDVHIYASENLNQKGRSSLEVRLIIALVTAIALWDLGLAETLLNADIDKILNPAELLEELSQGHNWAYDNADFLRWHLGTKNVFDHQVCIHSALVDRRELEHRIWQAQVGVLLPYVEEQRQRIIEELRNYLEVPFKTEFGQLITERQDLEIGHIYSQIQSNYRIDILTREKVEYLRDIRNQLAHLEYIKVDLLKKVFQLDQQLPSDKEFHLD
jgi:hypothetical protein